MNDYATPIAWIDINTSDAKQGQLDQGEPTKVAQISHFQAPYLDGAEIKSYKVGTNTKETKFDGAATAEFKAELVNQSGKVFTGGYTLGKVTYTVFNTGGEDVEVDGVVISPNRSETFAKDNGASLLVKSKDQKTTSVRVIATGVAYKDNKDFSFTAKEATATFTNSKVVAAPYTGYVEQFNTADTGTNSNSLWFYGKNPIKYTGTNVEYYGANGNQIFGETAWETYLTSLIGNDVTLSYSKDGEKTIFKVISVVDVPGTQANELKTYAPPAAANNAPTAKTVGTQTLTVGGANLTLTTAQLAEDVDTGDVLTILAAYTGNATVATVTNVGTSITVTPVATGTTTVTAIVADNHGAQTTVTFNVTVNPTVYVKAVNANPTVPYQAAVPTAPTHTIVWGAGVTAAGDLDIVADKTLATIALVLGATAQDVVDAINVEAQAVASEVVASLNAAGNIEITRPTTGVASTIVVDGDGTLAFDGNVVTTTTVAGTAGTATPARYAFDVETAIAPASGVTVKVKLGSAAEVTLVEGTDFTGQATATATAAELVSELNASTLGADYTFTVVGSTVVITQNVAAPTTGVTLTVSAN